MPRQVQNRVLELVETALGTTLARESCPPWLRRPGRQECRDLWPTVQAIYGDLTDGQVLPDEMPARERRSIDAIYTDPSGLTRLVEVDESQHFGPARARTLTLYPPDTETAYDRDAWAARSTATTRLPGGGFARPCSPLFPDAGGRHLQRAFRDTLSDLLPPLYGYTPTLRIGDHEVLGWLFADDAVERMATLLARRGVTG
jgi:hypothetical protein